MNPELIQKKQNEINELLLILNSIISKLYSPEPNEILDELFWKISYIIQMLRWSRDNLHLEEGVKICNYYIPETSKPEFVHFILDEDDAYMDEKYGEN